MGNGNRYLQGMVVTLHVSSPRHASPSTDGNSPVEVLLKAKKKYKPIALKVKPIVGKLPKEYWIVRNCVGNLLRGMPTLPPFSPTGWYNTKCREQVSVEADVFCPYQCIILIHTSRDKYTHLVELITGKRGGDRVQEEVSMECVMSGCPGGRRRGGGGGY